MARPRREEEAPSVCAGTLVHHEQRVRDRVEAEPSESGASG